MSVETPPEKKSTSERSDKPTEHLDSVARLGKALESFVQHLAKLIVTKNWVSLLLLIDAVLILFCFPGGIVPKFVKTAFKIELPKQYSVFFWVAVGGILLAALVIAIRTIQKKSPSIPDFTERKAIKGLRAFTKEDAEIFARLEREKDLRECLESITNDTFRLGILMGESGVGKSSFLQAGIIPQLAKAESSHRGVYIRFSNQEPIATIYRALAEELELSTTETTEIHHRDLLEIFSLAVATADKPLILIFDQFEQFFVHFKQKVDREPFVNALKDWYCAENPLAIEILISVREDLSGRLIELQKALGYSLSPYEVFRLEKFAPESATKVLQVIASAEEILFDEKFMLALTREELASREDGLISPVDLQVLAKTIERQKDELQAFNRPAFQKIGGIEGLMTRFLQTTLDARMIPRHREAAIKVLLAMINLDRNVRAGALTIEEIQQKTQGTLTPGEIVEAITWLASGEVRLITSTEQDGDARYELAHERLIPALREEAKKELTSADRANQLLDRRVNEWLGNQKSSRYLFNWQELRLFKQQKPYLVWGGNKIHKKKLLQRSWKKLIRQLVAIAMVLIFCLMGIGWWHTPWGQIQQARWELAGLSKRVSSQYKGDAALAFSKDGNLKQALIIAEQIDDLSNKARVLVTIAWAYGDLNNVELADKYLKQAVAAAQQIDDSSSKSRVLEDIAWAIGVLNNIELADKYLIPAVTAAQQIDDSYDKARILTAIALAYSELNNIELADKCLKQAVTAVEQIDDLSDKAWVLAIIAWTYGKLNNIELADKYLKQAVTIAQQIDDSTNKVWVNDKVLAFAIIAGIISDLNDIKLADKYLTPVITVAEQIDDSLDKARVLAIIAGIISDLNDIKLADKYLTPVITVAEQIDDLYSEALVLTAIAQTYGDLNNVKLADKYLTPVITVAEQIDDSTNRAWVLKAIAQTYGKLNNIKLADKYLKRTVAAAEQIDNSFDKARVLEAIAQTQVEFDRWRQAHNTVFKCPDDGCKVGSLAHILTAWAEKKNPALINKEDRFFYP